MRVYHLLLRFNYRFDKADQEHSRVDEDMIHWNRMDVHMMYAHIKWSYYNRFMNNYRLTITEIAWFSLNKALVSFSEIIFNKFLVKYLVHNLSIVYCTQ